MLTPLTKELAADLNVSTLTPIVRWEDPEVRASDIHYFAHHGLDVDGDIDHTGQFIQYLPPKEFGTSVAHYPKLYNSVRDTSEEYRARDEHIATKGWFKFNDQQADVIAELYGDSNIMELMAGRGYVAHKVRAAMERRGSTGTYRAYDNGSWTRVGTVGRVSKRNVFNTPIKKADVIVMGWPPYSENHAYRVALKMVPGQVLLYQGEGPGGCCANPRFFIELENSFKLLSEVTRRLMVDHESFMGIHDEWHAYVKVGLECGRKHV